LPFCKFIKQIKNRSKLFTVFLFIIFDLNV
jgi:hypothetical protein